MSEIINPIDVHIGRRLRLFRRKAGITQEDLGRAGGITFQQVQKYENGANRLSASMMWAFCKLLRIKPAALFVGLEDEDSLTLPEERQVVSFVDSAEGREFIEAAMKLSPALRDAYLNLMLAQLSPPPITSREAAALRGT